MPALLKLKLVLITTLLVLSSYFYSFSQYILAGQMSGENIYYIDMQDVLVSTSNGDYDYVDIDIDQDGQFDIRIYCYYQSFHTGYEYGSVAKGYSGAKVAALTDHNWVKQYFHNQAIGHNCNWSGEATIRGYTYDITTGSYTYGIFEGEGYIGFIIPQSTDTITGWIRIKSTSISSLWVYDYAYYSATTSIKTINRPDIKVTYNSPVENYLWLTFSDEINHSEYSYCIIDLMGRFIMSDRIHANQATIDLQTLPSGMYLLLIHDDKIKSYSGANRFIKK